MWAVGLLFLDLLFGKYIFVDLPGLKGLQSKATYKDLLTAIHLVFLFQAYYTFFQNFGDLPNLQRGSLPSLKGLKVADFRTELRNRINTHLNQYGLVL
jgi:hypothetical protein